MSNKKSFEKEQKKENRNHQLINSVFLFTLLSTKHFLKLSNMEIKKGVCVCTKIYFIPSLFVNRLEINCSIGGGRSGAETEKEGKEPKAHHLTSMSQPDPTAFPTEDCMILFSKA